MRIYPSRRTPILVTIASIAVLATAGGYSYGLVPEWHLFGLAVVSDDTVMGGFVLAVAGSLLAGIRFKQCRSGRAVVIDDDGLTNHLRLFGVARIPRNDIRGLLVYQGWFGDELVVLTRFRKIRLRWLSISEDEQASIQEWAETLPQPDLPRGSLGAKLSRRL